MPKAKIVLGEKYRDKTSGIEGIAITKTTYLNGCVYYQLRSGFNKDTGKIINNNVPEIFLESVK